MSLFLASAYSTLQFMQSCASAYMLLVYQQLPVQQSLGLNCLTEAQTEARDVRVKSLKR